MAPPPPAAAIMDDLIVDILLRLPPDDTACLTRASLVCKAWHRLVSDPAFIRRYREIHGSPPFLGFLYNDYNTGGISPFFIPTTPASPFSQQATAGSPTRCRTLDCRHGRVLLHHHDRWYTPLITVWDPVTGLQQCLPAPVTPLTAAVLCAYNDCDHLDCSDGPYLVVLMAKTKHLGIGVAPARARFHLYSSESNEWFVSASTADLVSLRGSWSPSLLAGDALFFLAGSGQVLKCELTSGVVSSIWVPHYPGQNMVLCTVEDGGLGVAIVEGRSLHLMSGRTNPDGVTKWTQSRVIELDWMITDGVCANFCVVGFAEGTGYIFVRANDIIFSVEVKSGRISKIGTGKFGPIFPLLGFYIPDVASLRLQVPNCQ